jgi:TolB protein
VYILLAALPLLGAAAPPRHDLVFVRGSMLFVRDANGERSLGHHGTNPVWAPDGKSIAFEFGNDVVTIRGDGTHERRLVADAIHPAWSPDGTRLAYTSADPANFDVYVVDADGQHPRRLTRGFGVDAAPSWSPDGTRIVYQSQRWCAVRTLPGCSTQIFVMRADGTHKHRLTSSWSDNARPRFSPDGSRIVWVRAYLDYYENLYTGLPDGSRWQVLTARADGSHARILTGTRVRAWAPTFTPDGDKIVFALERVYPPWHLAAVPATGGPVRLLTHGGRDDSDPDWRR